MNYEKKIWLDLRFLDKNNNYSKFIYELINLLIKENPNFLYNIYLSKNYSKLSFPSNTKKIIANQKLWSFSEHTSFYKKLKKDNNDLMIFFNYKKPLNYKENYILFVPELTNFHFPEKINSLKKHMNNFLIQNSINKSKKIICFNKEIYEEINDKLNIDEEKINIIKPFFIKDKKLDSEEIKEKLPINIKTKYNINWDYIIYNSGTWTEKNLDRIVEVFKKIKENNINLNLVILDKQTIKNVNFRKQVLQKNVVEKIFFIWETNEFEKEYFYKNCLFIIYPTLYSIFPFSLNDWLNFNTNILSSNLKNIKNIFGNKINYFNETDINDIYDKIINYENKKINYQEILNNNKINKTVLDLKKIIESV